MVMDIPTTDTDTIMAKGLLSQDMDMAMDMVMDIPTTDTDTIMAKGLLMLNPLLPLSPQLNPLQPLSPKLNQLPLLSPHMVTMVMDTATPMPTMDTTISAKDQLNLLLLL